MPMSKKEMIHFWIDSSNEDYQTMLNLFLSKDYSWCLFMGHIVIEKLIKALYVKQTADTPPFIIKREEDSHFYKWEMNSRTNMV